MRARRAASSGESGGAAGFGSGGGAKEIVGSVGAPSASVVET